MPDHRKVAVFWDYVSSHGCAIVNGIRRIAHIFGSVTTFKTYLDLSSQSSKNSVVFRSELQSSGVSIIDCPHNGKKDVVDKMIVVDMLAFAIDHQSPATVILIAGDRDYAYALSTLRLRQYSVILIIPSGQNVPQTLQSQASVVLDWNYAILGKCPDADTPPFRLPYHDLDEEIVERLTREIRGSNEDPAVTLISSSHPTSTAPAHTRSVSAAELSEPSVFQRNTDSSGAVRLAPMCMPKKAAASVFPETPGHSRVGSGASRARFTTQSTYAVPDIDRGSGSPFSENNALSDECVSTANEIQDAPHDPFARPFTMSPRLERHQNIAEPGSPPIVNFRYFSPSPAPSATCNLGSRTTPLPSLLHSRTISGGTSVSYGNPPQRSASTAIPSSPVSTGGNSTATAPKSRNAVPASAIVDDSILPSDHAAVMAALGLDDEDEANNEVDDHSHTYAMNAVDPPLKEGWAYSPANNTSPPLTEPYGTPTSEESSSSSPITYSSVTVPNVETGPPQTTPVISDNGNHSSGDHEPVEDKIRRLTPLRFLPLINQLLLARSKGIEQASMFKIAVALLQYDKDIYIRVGVNKFRDYASLAERASLIELGGREGQAWIALHPNWFKDETMPQSPTPSSVHSNSSPAPQGNIKTPASFTTTTPPSFGSRAATPNSETPQPPPDASDKRIPFCFYPLVTRMVHFQKNGMTKPLRSSVGLILGPAVYVTAGVSTLKQYLTLAVQDGIVELGGSDDYAWVMLHPDVLNGKRTF